MGVILNVEEVDYMLEAMNRSLSEVRAKTSVLITNFREYIDNDNLKSVAYDNHKNYIESMQLPVADGIREFCERMISANKRYASAVLSYFPENEIINEDKWREEYEAIKEQYDSINTTYIGIVESINALSGSGYYPMTEYVQDKYGMNPKDGESALLQYYRNVKVTYQEELEILYHVLARYRERINRIGQMLTELSGIYAEAEQIKDALVPAIYRLNEITVNANGDYVTGMADCSVFSKLQTCLVSIDVSEGIRNDMGDELLSAREFEALDDTDKMNYANRLSEIAATYLPSLSGEMVNGYIEIPVGPGMTFYLENSATNNFETGNPILYKSAYDDNMNVLCTAGVDFGGIELNINPIGYEFYGKKKLDGNTDIYVKLEEENIPREVTLEWGATTTISNYVGNTMSDEDIHTASVTTACGIKAKVDGTRWDNKPTSDYILEPLEEPVSNLSELPEGFVTPAPGIPAPFPFPIF